MNEIRQYIIEAYYYGKKGAGVLVISQETNRALIAYRSRYVEEPHTWNIISGKIDGNEDPKTAALRELREETEYRGTVKFVDSLKWNAPDADFKFYNFIGLVDEEFKAHPNWETEQFKWVTYQQLLGLSNKHFGLENLIQKKKSSIRRHMT